MQLSKSACLLALVLLAGCSSDEESNPTSSTDAGSDARSTVTSDAGSGSDAAASSFDQQFIDMMTPHHQSAVEMAKIAQTRAEHAEIKTMANAIISAQEKEIGELKSWRKAWYGSDETPPMSAMPMLDGMMGMGQMEHDMTQSIESLKTANPFDRAFIDEMIPHHESAIEAARLALQKAQHAEIKKLATEIIASQQAEIDQMKTWRAAWYGDSMDAGSMGDSGMGH
jgi:uncharacterized protein (DUF305 family)